MLISKYFCDIITKKSKCKSIKTVYVFDNFMDMIPRFRNIIQSNINRGN